MPGENALLVPGVDQDSNWVVHRYEIDTEKANFLTTGYDAMLSPEASSFATAYEGWAWVFDLELLTSEPLASGDPLAWTPAGVVVGTRDSLQVIDPANTTGAARELLAGAAYYVNYTLNPVNGVQAVTRITQKGTELLFLDADGTLTADALLPGLAESLAWFDEDRLLLSLSMENLTSRIMRFTLADRTLSEALPSDVSWTDFRPRTLNLYIGP